ncbi:MAG TPA: ABC transporter permease [Gemmatimonadota bacterium]|nr:ABC transporter permease [Gemmatimonadota bacterium]
MRRPPWWVSGIAGAALFLLHLPVVVLMAFSFNASRFSMEWSGFTLIWYARLLERGDILEALRASLVVALASTALATALGTLIALALARHAFPGRRVYQGLLYLPIVTPEIVVGISLLVLFAAAGVQLGLGTITIAHVAFNISFVAVVVLARLQGMGRDLEEAAMDLGARPWTTFFRITLPQILPGVVAGALLAFTMSFDDFVITFFVAGVGSTTLPLLVYSMVRRGVEPTINAISTIILVVTTVAILVAYRLREGRSA